MKGLGKARVVGGSVVVTIPKEIVREKGIVEGEMLEISVEKSKRSFFGAAMGINPFSKKDEL